MAVTDSGVAYDHPDLKPNLWHNPRESGGGRETNGRDDDRNGLVDDWQGWDFAGADNDPRDLESHGSHVAGIIGARGNNARRHDRRQLAGGPDGASVSRMPAAW